MAEKPVIKVGHLQITDHLILGITALKLQKGKEQFKHCSLQPVPMIGWNNVSDALSAGQIDGAFILAPTAMDLYNSGVGIKLILFTHKSGSVLVKNKHAHIEKLEDFAGKVVLIPYQLSVHNMLFHKLLSDKGLRVGTGKQKGVDVLLEVMAPSQMPEVLRYDEDGEVGGFIVAEPFGSEAIASGVAQEIFISKQVWNNHPCCVFVMRDDIIKNNPKGVQEIVLSLVKSGLSIQMQPDIAAKLGAKILHQNEEVMERVLTDERQPLTTNELMPVIEDLERIQDYMTDVMGIMTEKIDIEKFVDLRFAKEIGAR